VEEFVRVRIDGSVQPALLVVDPDCRLIDRNAIRTLTVSWL
jgi:hypothetical protein